MTGSEIAPRAILLDIEGTTTPISFVTEKLFPYARRHGRDFILSHLHDGEIEAALRQLQAENAGDGTDGARAAEKCSPNAVEETIQYYLWLIDVDRKSTPLKTIQGRIWEGGYARGDLQSDIFPDVFPALKRWRRQGMLNAIYSSGSVLAQQQLFRHTVEGDLTPLIDAYFDTRVGNKRQADSYRKIAVNLKLLPNDVLFVSDVTAELDAALETGMRTALCVRPGNPSSPDRPSHPAIRSFEELV
ncbi:MAG TPA: acireductone synthase [Bryobacteraceae bacterium]